jgi:hypothetical protein
VATLNDRSILPLIFRVAHPSDFASGKSGAVAVPQQETPSAVARAFGGVGVTVFISNAGNSQGLKGPFETISGNVGGGAGASVSLSFDHSGTFVLQVTALIPGAGVSAFAVTTNTVQKCAGCN